MKAEYKIKRHILVHKDTPPGLSYDEMMLATATEEMIDELWDNCDLDDELYEFRESGVDAAFVEGVMQPISRHYEIDVVYRRLVCGSFVGWFYYHGGGKHSEPEAYDWLSTSFNLNVVSERKIVEYTFAKAD